MLMLRPLTGPAAFPSARKPHFALSQNSSRNSSRKAGCYSICSDRKQVVLGAPALVVAMYAVSGGNFEQIDFVKNWVQLW